MKDFLCSHPNNCRYQHVLLGFKHFFFKILQLFPDSLCWIFSLDIKESYVANEFQEL